MSNSTDESKGLKSITESCSDQKIKDMQVNCEEVVKPEPKKVVFVGFDRIADDMKKKVSKLARQKGISSFNIMGIPTKEGVPKYSGGMVGNPEVLIEGLYNMANQRPEIKALLTITVNALNEAETLKITDLTELKEKGRVSAEILQVLEDMDIFNLSDLLKYTYADALNFDGIDEGMVKTLDKMLTDRGMRFKKGEKS